ncbi:hypothetical protein [Porphyromonas gingivicanis]|uniref:hypothetical protein n=1 Tax=Porphyromonas gingivicanis TaxID=266762 RepID=UPI00046F0B5B|nr:hypothetical protein [Porphyromonas gingivicanis]
MIYDELAFAITHCHLSPSEFAELTIPEWQAIVKAQLQKEEQENKQRWEQTRVIAYTSVIPHMKNSQSITDFMPFPWDEEEQQNVARPPTRAEREELLKKFGG